MRFLILALVACTRTAPVPPKPAPNAAAAIADAFVANAQTKCTLWTGRGTPYGGVDSVLCVGPAQVIYVAAPTDGPPTVRVALQFESPPDAKKEEATKEEAPKDKPTLPVTPPKSPKK